MTHRFRVGLSLAALLALASCSGVPRKAAHPGLQYPSREDVVRFARTFLGTPYKSGGVTYQGVDCSGLTVAVYKQFDIRLPRTSHDQSRAGVPIERSELQPADLVFFRTSQRTAASHVGIYLGKGNFIHAATSERTVRIDALSDAYYRHRYVSARRVLGS